MELRAPNSGAYLGPKRYIKTQNIVLIKKSTKNNQSAKKAFPAKYEIFRTCNYRFVPK